MLVEADLDMEHLGAAARPDRRSPEAEARRYDRMQLAFPLVSPIEFEHSPGNEMVGDHLSAMRMAGETDVDAALLGGVQLQRLMVQQNERHSRIERLYQLGNRLPLLFPAAFGCFVLAADDDEA